MSKTRLILSLLFILPLISAYTVELSLWENLNKTTLYTNEFMTCYLYNDTHTFYDTYQSGQAEIVTPDINMSYDIGCCDNCYFSGDMLFLAPNSFVINPVDTNMSITTDTHLDYYVGEELRTYRTALGVSEASGRTVRGYAGLAGIVVLVLVTISIPMLIMALYPELASAQSIAIGASLGYMFGLGICGAFSLLSLGALSFLGLLGLLFFIFILGGMVKLHE